MKSSTLLFSKHDLEKLISDRDTGMQEAINKLPREYILETDESELISYLDDEGAIATPELRRDETAIVDARQHNLCFQPEFSVLTPSAPDFFPDVIIAAQIPFSGDVDIFDCKVAQAEESPPQAYILTVSVLICSRDFGVSKNEQIKMINDEADRIDLCLDCIEENCRSWNENLPTLAQKYIQHRKKLFSRSQK